MMNSPRQVVSLGMAVVFAAASWHVALSSIVEYHEEIAVFFADALNEAVLPYKLLQLSLYERDSVLPMPVYGVARSDVADTWGQARTEGRSHEGVDIFAERGTPVFSATVGYVVRVDFGFRGGSNVMVVGPGGVYYYYAHFERRASGIERGTYVTPDTILGYVGNSGNAVGTPPHLHFGVYLVPWNAINPYPLLVDRWN